MTQDPIRDGLNWYTYCNNNPIGLIDPLGLDPIPGVGGYSKLKDNKPKYSASTTFYYGQSGTESSTNSGNSLGNSSSNSASSGPSRNQARSASESVPAAGRAAAQLYGQAVDQSHYNYYMWNEWDDRWGYHAGVDFFMERGKKLYSISDGTVVHAGKTTGGTASMLVVEVADPFKTEQMVYIIYLHLNISQKIIDGYTADGTYFLSQGDLIGAESNVGSGGTVHTHIEVSGVPKNALPAQSAYWMNRGVTVPDTTTTYDPTPYFNYFCN